MNNSRGCNNQFLAVVGQDESLRPKHKRTRGQTRSAKYSVELKVREKSVKDLQKLVNRASVKIIQQLKNYVTQYILAAA